MQVKLENVKTIYLHDKALQRFGEYLHADAAAARVLIRESRSCVPFEEGLVWPEASRRVRNWTTAYVLKGLGYEATEADRCLFVKAILLHVDDMLIATKDDTEYRSVRKHQDRRFRITCLGNVKKYFGIPFERQENGGFLLRKECYITKVLAKFEQEEPAKPSHIPKDPGYVTAEQKEEKVVATTQSLCLRMHTSRSSYHEVHPQA